MSSKEVATAIVLGGGLGLLVGVLLSIRFANPALTETQLFLRFWWVYVPIIAAVVIGALVARWRVK